MAIMKFSRHQRLFALCLFPLMLFFLLEAPVVGQEKSAEEARATNVKWTTKGDVISVNYDLTGSLENKYTITVMMKKESDPSFSATPLTVEGDVGEGVLAGTNKELQWYYRRDYPQGFQGEGYFFEILVKPVHQQNMLLYYILGGVAVTGGIVALVISKGQSNPVISTALPMPPPRP
jgi:hypothetical protein